VNRVDNFEQALLQLIDVYLRLDKKGDLRNAYSEYLRHYPDNLGIRKNFAQFLYSQASYAQACTEVEKILPYEPKNTEYRIMLAHSYRETKKYPEAILLYRELILEAPKSLDLVRPLVFCLEENGSRETVILLLEKAIKLFKDDSWLQLRLGSLYTAQGQLEKAAKIFRSVISLDPNDWQAHSSLGKIYGKMGNNQFAERFVKRAKELKQAQSGTEEGGRGRESPLRQKKNG